MKKASAIMYIIGSILLLLCAIGVAILMLVNKEAVSIIAITGVVGTFMVVGFLFKTIYIAYIDAFKNLKRYKKLSDEEQELVNDAKELFQEASRRITITDFNVYKVGCVKGTWTFLEDGEINIFIPFKRLLKLDKDICFYAIVHEILYAQNWKHSNGNSERDEKLNRLLALWLIKNYSKKYKAPTKAPIMSLRYSKKDKFDYKEEFAQLRKVVLRKYKTNIVNVFVKYFEGKELAD